MTRAGDLRDRVGFYRPQAMKDGYGNAQTAPQGAIAFDTVAAAIVPKLGGEQVLADRLTSVNTVNITVRTSRETLQVTSAWKVRDERKGIEYNVRSIVDPNSNNAQRGQFLEMLCQEGVAI